VYLAWRYGGEEPYRLYNSLDSEYVPIEGGERTPPLYPARLRYFIYGCAVAAFEEEAELAGAKISGRGQ
jgi:hypothetical protein